MSIRNEPKWGRKLSKLVGSVDYGDIKGEISEAMATNILVVMAVGRLKRLNVSHIFDKQKKKLNTSLNSYELYNTFL